MIRPEIKMLWHYTTVCAGVEILKTGLFKLSAPAALNDPFDIDPEFITTDVPAHEFIASVFADCLREGLKWEQVREKLDRCVNPDGSLSPLSLQRIAELSGRIEGDYAGERLLCLTEDPLSILMWSHYANKHTGVCLGFARNPGSTFADDGKTRPVKYTDEYPSVTVADLRHEDHRFFQKTLYTKALGWHYEREWRAFFPHHGDLQIRGLICRVIFGLNTPNTKEADKLAELCREHGISVSMCKKVPGKFQLELVEDDRAKTKKPRI